MITMELDTNNPMITITDVMEYTYCPRFIYFMYCLDIPQYEGSRLKVQKGREIHHKKYIHNKDYFRKKLDCLNKESEVFLSSSKNRIRGIVDEVLFLNDGTAAPFEYKFAEHTDRTYKPHIYQLLIQALLIKENYGKNVEKGYICYTRSNNLVKERLSEKSPVQII